MWLQFWAGKREDKSTSQTVQNTNLTIISIRTDYTGFFSMNLFFPRNSWSWGTDKGSLYRCIFVLPAGSQTPDTHLLCNAPSSFKYNRLITAGLWQLPTITGKQMLSQRSFHSPWPNPIHSSLYTMCFWICPILGESSQAWCLKHEGYRSHKAAEWQWQSWPFLLLLIALE